MVTELLPVFERLHAGHEVDWDGSNHVGKLSDDASQASDEIDSACNQLGSSGSLINIYTAEEYFFEYCSLLDAWSVDQTLAQAVEAAEIIIDEDQAVSDDIETAFLVKAEEVFEESPKTLGTTHIEALLGDDRISADDAAQWAADNK